MRLGRVCGLAVVLIEQPAHFWEESPVSKAFLRAIRAELSGTPLLRLSMHMGMVYWKADVQVE